MSNDESYYEMHPHPAVPPSDPSRGTDRQPGRRSKADEDKETCVICFEDITDREDVSSSTSCSHFMCTGEFVEWLKKSHTCPHCRKKVHGVQTRRGQRVPLPVLEPDDGFRDALQALLRIFVEVDGGIRQFAPAPQHRAVPQLPRFAAGRGDNQQLDGVVPGGGVPRAGAPRQVQQDARQADREAIPALPDHGGEAVVEEMAEDVEEVNADEIEEAGERPPIATIFLVDSVECDEIGAQEVVSGEDEEANDHVEQEEEYVEDGVSPSATHIVLVDGTEFVGAQEEVRGDRPCGACIACLCNSACLNRGYDEKEEVEEVEQDKVAAAAAAKQIKRRATESREGPEMKRRCVPQGPAAQ